jgi:MFS family permease
MRPHVSPEAAEPARGGYVVGVCFCIAVFGWGLGFYGPGFYLLELRARHPWPAVQISAAATCYFLCGAALIMVLPAALARWGARRTIVAGICAMAASTAALPSVDALWQLYAVYLLMAAGWATMSSTAIAAVVAPWFTRRRGLALSLALNGSSCGGILIIPALVHLTAHRGFPAATRTAAGVMLILLLPLAWAALGRPAPGAGRPGHQAARSPGRLDLLRRPRFWSVAAPFALGLMAQVGFLNHQLSLLAPALGPGPAALAVSCTAAAALIGRVGLGLVIDRLNLRSAAAGVFALQAAALAALALWGATGVLAACLTCGAFGLSVGNVITLPALIVQQEFPPATFTQVISLSTAVGQAMYAFGPVLLAAILDTTAGYRPALTLCITLEAAAAVIVRLQGPGPTPHHSRRLRELTPGRFPRGAQTKGPHIPEPGTQR